MVRALRVGEAVTQRREPAGGLHLDAASVHLGGPGEYGSERVDGGQLAVLAFPGPSGLLGVDEDPLVAQPYDGARRLGEPVQLGAAQLLTTQREPPVEGEQRVGGQEGRQVRFALFRAPDAARVVLVVQSAARRVVRRADDGACRQLACQGLRPVHLNTGGGQCARGFPEQFGDLLVGEVDGVGHRGRQERGQRRPGACGASEGQQGVHPGPGSERLVRGVPGPRTGPYLGGVGDDRRVADAVHL